MSTDIEVKHSGGMMTLKGIADRVNMVHRVMEKVMLKGTHYGTVPGCGQKMVLFKPGADVLAMTFQLVPQFAVTKLDIGNGHREYDVTCTMYSAGGVMLGQGVGSGSTMEKKYRYRKDANGKNIENEDIADVYNTVLKMAKKRAQIDATLTVTGAADMFTQDLIEEEAEAKEPIREPQAKAGPTPPPVSPTPEGDVITGVIQAVSVKDGEGAKGPWKKYGVKVDDMWHSTFDHKIGEQAEGLKGKEATINYTTDAKGYRNIVSIK